MESNWLHEYKTVFVRWCFRMMFDDELTEAKIDKKKSEQMLIF